MTLQIIAFRPPPGVWAGLDTVGDDNSPGYVITPSLAEELYEKHHIRWIARYMQLDGEVPEKPIPGGEYGPAVANGCWPLSQQESRWILGAGVAIVPVQFASFGGLRAAQRQGAAMVTAARKLGWPLGVHLYNDTEGLYAQQAGYAKVTEVCEAAAAAKLAAGQLAGQYYTGGIMAGRSWGGLAGVTSYWGAAGPLAENPYDRGCHIEQDNLTTLCGLKCDTDTMRPDRFGTMPSIIGTPEIRAAWYAEALATLAGSPALTA